MITLVINDQCKRIYQKDDILNELVETPLPVGKVHNGHWTPWPIGKAHHRKSLEPLGKAGLTANNGSSH